MIHMNKEKKTRVFPIRLTENEYKKLKIEALERGMPGSRLVSMALSEFFRKYNRE